MNRKILLALIVLLLPLAAFAADDKYTLQFTAPARPADVLTLRGKQRFNRGQMRNIAFYIGENAVGAQFISADEVRLVVPDVDSGTYAVKVVKHDRNPGRDIILFAQNIFIEADREQVLASVTGVLGSGPGELTLPGVVTIEAAEDSARPPGTYEIEQVESRSVLSTFKSMLVSGFDRPADNLPPLAASSFVRITTTSQLQGFLAVRMPVPAAFLATVPSGFAPELYATVYDTGADDEVITRVAALHATYDSTTQTLIAPLPAQMFVDEEGDLARGAVAANAVPVKKVTLTVSVQSITAPICFDGQVIFPPSAQIEATSRDILSMQAKLKFQVPERLLNPTIYSPPERTGSFGGKHTGVDLRSANSDALYAAHDGTVADTYLAATNPKKKNWQGIPQGGGWTVLIDSPDGRRTGYAHMLPGSIVVSSGDSVVGGQSIIGAADSSGGVTGPHLHLSYTVCGTKIDPWPFLQANGPTAQSFYDEFSVATVVNGMVIKDSTRRVSDFVFASNGNFTYQAPVDLGKLNLTPGQTVPLEIRVIAKTTGNSTTIYKGKVKIKAASLRAVLTWDTNGTDVDLHVNSSTGQHAFYGAKFGITNGVLDYDDVDGYGPETFTLSSRPAGVTYTISVHYYSDHGYGPTTATVKVYLDDKLETTFTTPLTNGQSAT
ncbi:MAG TPA: peptidoglycan DD-metalloendopeptidase family protein, partial [Thermoanaerobaculia bacterium]|nr:peptidoglycan DD-metalloendopeptidase family protein [Thermoanaerobaculia bacterium]